jgi:aspartyl-tRNA(Asn)/glutamyl-tRNA(Gln) amidotransferase subunit A
VCACLEILARIVVVSAAMADFPEDLSRRSLIKVGLAGAIGSLANFRRAATAARARVSGLAAAAQNAEGTKRMSEGPHNDLANLSLREAAELVRTKKVSPVELTKACLARIEVLNPALNCFITITADSALERARAAETEVMGGKWRGPLHGIPIALKDLFDTAGVKTTAGSGVFKDRIPTEDAEVVRRLKNAGAVLLGKTNMQEFAFGGSSLVSYFGAVHNPWEPNHIAGGSSGGSAAAVAAGLCYGALGSDTAASVRVPAAHCGIVGLKPTYGLVSIRGVIPLSWSLDHVGPMARTVADTAVLLQAIAGYDPEDITSEEMKVPDYAQTLRTSVAPVRIGAPREFFFADLDPDIDAAMTEALSVLGKLTAGIRNVALQASTMEALRNVVRAAEAFAYHRDFIAKTPELYQLATLERIKLGADVTTPAYILARRELAQLRRTAGKVFESVDALITPTLRIPPLAISDPRADDIPPIVHNTSPFNVYGWPAISIPCGFTKEGLPIGLQIVGPHGGESLVFQLAHAYEQATEWHKRRPTIAASASKA